MTATVLALTLTTAAAQAQYPQYRSDRYPDRNQADRVTSQAYDLARTAAAMHREFERNNRRPSRGEEQVAAQLHALSDQASHFYSEIGGYGHEGYGQDRYGQDRYGRGGYGHEGYGQDLRHTQRDFERVLQAYDQTIDTLRYIGRRGYVDQGMERIAYLLSDLNRYYGVSGWNRGRYNRYDRDGRGGYDRYDRDGYDRDRYDRQDDRDGYRPPQSH
jgi:hypothetical protein